jgi:hypothetical protein
MNFVSSGGISKTGQTKLERRMIDERLSKGSDCFGSDRGNYAGAKSS